MKLKLTFLLFLLVSVLSYGQTKAKLSGQVFDKDLNEAVPYATVTLKNADQIVTGGMTDSNGRFSITVTADTYSMDIQFIGYKDFHKDLDLKNNLDMGTIFLLNNSTTLDDVNIVVEQSTIEQKIDRKVINVGRDLTTAGATAGEIMNNIPSVNVDKDGKISLRGNENVRILVDGRPTNMSSEQILKQIPSSSIKSIELITNPSAKYNPEGMSGIINIVLHKNTADGFNGSIDLGLTTAKSPKSTNSINLNYRKGKFNFFGNANYSEGKYHNEGHMYRSDIKSPTDIDMVSNSESFLYKVGVDYFLNDKNTISFYTNQSKNTNVLDLYNATTYPDNLFDDIFQSTIYNGTTKNSTYNLAYKHLFEKKGHTLDFEANYNKVKSGNDGNYDTNIENNKFIYTDLNDSKNELATLNIDYVNPLNDHTKLEAGAEARFSKADNVFNSSNPLIPEDQRNIYNEYDQNIFSAYATFGQTYGKFNYQVGARLESYQVESKLSKETTYKQDYVTLYPSAYLGYSMTDNDMFNLSFSRRVDRPSLQQTNPVRQYSTPLMTMVGNPELEPQFTNSVELNYTRMFAKRSSITAGIYYRRIKHEINHVIYDDPDNDNPNALIQTYDNYKSNDAYGFEVSANVKLTSWWDMQPAIDFSSIRQTGLVSKLNAATMQMDMIQRTVTANAFNARLNSNFKASDKLRFNLFGFYRGAVDGITTDSKSMYKIDAGARYSIIANKFSISMRVNDIFNTMSYRYSTEFPYASNGEFKWESRSLYLGVNYMFGGKKSQTLQRKSRDSNTKQSSSSGGIF